MLEGCFSSSEIPWLTWHRLDPAEQRTLKECPTGALPKTGELLFVANGVNADDGARCVFDRLIAGDRRYTNNRCLAVVWVTCLDCIEGGAAEFASKRVWHSRCDADIFVALALYE